MTQSEQILLLAKENHGIITSAKMDELGLPRMMLKFLVRQKKLTKLSRGVYGLPGTQVDVFFNEYVRVTKGIFCLMSALYLLGYCESLPNTLQMSFPKTYNVAKPKERGVLCLNQTNSVYGVGAIEVYTPRGNKVRVYSIERTLCECLSREEDVDMAVVRKAIAKYLHSGEVNIPLLETYGKMFGVYSRVKFCIDFLL